MLGGVVVPGGFTTGGVLGLSGFCLFTINIASAFADCSDIVNSIGFTSRTYPSGAAVSLR